jgi:hypothetical protein
MPDTDPLEQIKVIKLVTETSDSTRPHFLSSITDWLKIVGACVVVVAGSWAAVTGLQAVLAEKRAAETEKAALTAQIEELKKQQQDIVDLYKKTKGQAEAALALVSDLKTQAQEAAANQKQQDPQATVVKLQDAQGALSTLSESVDAGVASIAPPKEDIAPVLPNKRVFLQISNDNQRMSAEKIQQALKDLGCIVPGIQNIGGKGYVPDQTEIRYFRYPEDRDIAKTILDHLSKTTGLKNARISYVATDPSATKTGQLEIWFAKSYQ